MRALIEQAPLAGAKIARQLDRPVADAQQPADLVADGFPHAAHFPVAAFVEHQAIGGVTGSGFASGEGSSTDAIECRQDHLPGERRAGACGSYRRPADPVRRTRYSRSMLARGMHEAMGEIAIGGEEEQTRGVDIQSAHHDPAAELRRRQPLEDRGTALRVPARGHFAERLVIEQHLVPVGLRRAELQPAAIQADFIAGPARSPSLATRPATVRRPAAIHCST